MKTIPCPRCGAHLDEEENLTHDGYNGSPYAHGGRGSYGLGRHHYYFVCSCGWSQRPDIDREKLQRRRAQRQRFAGCGTPKYNGLVLPQNAKSSSDYVRFSCSSRWTLVERIAAELAPPSSPDHGTVCGHSLCASHTYTLVTKDCMHRAKTLAATGEFRGMSGRDIAKHLDAMKKAETVYNNDNH